MNWKPVKNYEEAYEVSENGNVRSIDRIVMNKTKNGKDRPCLYKGRELKPHKRPDGRFEVVLSKGGVVKSWGVHVLVAKAFVGDKPQNHEVNHIDGDHTNNHYKNLEWVTKKENIRHSFREGIMTTNRLVAMLDNDGNVEKVYMSEADACRKNGISQGKIGRAINRSGTSGGKRWKYVEEGVTTIEPWEPPT